MKLLMEKIIILNWPAYIGLETIFYKYFPFLPAKKQNRTGRHQNPMSWMQQLVKAMSMLFTKAIFSAISML